MPQNPMNPDKIQNTVSALAFLNIAVAPLYFVNTQLGGTGALLMNAMAIYLFHEIGRERRPVANALVRVNTFFAPWTGDTDTRIENALRNIINGGDYVLHERAPLLCE